MAASTPRTESPDYGVDTPDVIRRLLMWGSVALVIHFATPTIARLLPPQLLLALHDMRWSLAGMGYFFVATACWLLWASRSGKLRLRDRVLDALPWRGDEEMLDVGCARGLFAIGAARRLPRGRAVGVDGWQPNDPLRSGPEPARRNARLEGVAARVDIQAGEPRRLPFDAGRFDVVLSAWTLHRLPTRTERRRALEEMVRVLKPDGRLVLIDFRHAREYAETLRELGFAVQLGAPSWLFIAPSTLLHAQRAGSGTQEDR